MNARPAPAYRPTRALATARLRLRPVGVGDADELFHAYASDARVTRYLRLPTQTDAAGFRDVVTRLASGWDTGGATWVLETDRDRDLIGLTSVRDGPHGLELAYALAHDRWGRGLMTEAVRAVVEDARSQSSVFRVWAYHSVDNPASGRVLEKAGLTRETLLRRWAVFPNVSEEPADAVLFSWTRPAHDRLSADRPRSGPTGTGGDTV